MSSEPALRGIGFFRQTEKNLHDASVLIRRRIEKQSIIDEALDRGYCSAFFCGRWPDDGNGAELFVKEQSWLGHDEVGLEVVSNIRTGGTRFGINSAVEIWKCKVAIGDVRCVACLILPSLEVRDLRAADAKKNSQYLQISYFLGERGLQAAAALLDEREVKSRRVGNGL